MRDYQKQRREREPLVRELYGLGLSAREIADVTPWSQATLAQDINRLGGPKAFADRPTNKEELFRAVIRRYAEVIKEKNLLHQALATWLKESTVLATLYGLELAFEQLTVPGYPPEKKGYAQLLGSVFCLRLSPDRAEIDGKKWWHDTLEQIRLGAEEAPGSFWQLYELLVGRVLDEQRAEIMPVWGESVFSLVDEMLNTLSERERDVICWRFGLGVQKMTLREIGKQLGCTVEPVRQAEIRAIHKLRLRARQYGLNAAALPVGNALQRELAQHQWGLAAHE